MDINKILSLNIPDIHPTYGGVRGKTCRHVARGIEPPALRGYLKKTGPDTSKILRVLNAFYDRITEETGKEPMSVEEFKYRKQVIREQNKV